MNIIYFRKSAGFIVLFSLIITGLFYFSPNPGYAGTNYTIGSIGMPTWDPEFSEDTAIGTSNIARWKYGKNSALTISYDDSAIGNALHGIPQMANKGLVGTWFVNPGSSSYQKMEDVWNDAVSVYKQEIANHTMNHQGGDTEELALSAINDASEHIKENIYKIPPDSSKLLGFNKAGGTNWDISTTGAAWDQRIRENHLIERKYSTGFYMAMPFEEMKIFTRYKYEFNETDWASIHFHGICDDENDGNLNTAYYPSYIENCTCTHIPPECGVEPLETAPDYQNLWSQWALCRFGEGYQNSPGVTDCKDGGTGAVKKSDVYKYYDYLTDPGEYPAQQIWIAGFIAAKKYEIERNNGSINLLSANNTSITLNLEIPAIDMEAPLNQVNLYDEELTIFTKVPAAWTACRVTQNGNSHTYKIYNHEVRYEVVPNNGTILLENDTVENIDIPYVNDTTSTTYYVSTTGLDSNNGEHSSPFRTIQKAANEASGNDMVIVENGFYDEVVTISTSGTNDVSRVIFKSQTKHGAACTGFKIEADFITIDGFKIESSASNQNGVYVSGQSYINVTNCYILECPGGGINMTHNTTHGSITNNVLEHNGQWGVHVVGSYVVIENNEVFNTVQHHPKNEFTGFHGEDADGLRIFGDHHVIRGNYIHDLGNVEDPGNHQASVEYPDDYPHVDCIQSWDRSEHGGRPVIKDSVIENNRCSLSRASGKGVMISAIDNECSNITIRNNIFEYRDIGIAMSSGSFSNINIHNNLFKALLDDTPWGAAISLKDINTYSVLNNIMVDGHAEARKITGGSGVIDYNLVWYSDGSNPVGTPGAGEHEIWGVDPQFISYTGVNGGDYRLKSGSAAIDKGTEIPGLLTDIDGNKRPQADNYDIGPYEYIGPQPEAPKALKILDIQR